MQENNGAMESMEETHFVLSACYCPILGYLVMYYVMEDVILIFFLLT